MSERFLLEPSTAFFLIAFDPETLELVALEGYPAREGAALAMFRHTDEGRLATFVKAESEATLRATGDIEGIGRRLQEQGEEQRERAKANQQRIDSIVAGFPYPERRVFELCSSFDGPQLTHEEAAAEIGCSVKTVSKLWRRGALAMLERQGWH